MFYWVNLLSYSNVWPFMRQPQYIFNILATALDRFHWAAEHFTYLNSVAYVLIYLQIDGNLFSSLHCKCVQCQCNNSKILYTFYIDNVWLLNGWEVHIYFGICVQCLTSVSLSLSLYLKRRELRICVIYSNVFYRWVGCIIRHT